MSGVKGMKKDIGNNKNTTKHGIPLVCGHIVLFCSPIPKYNDPILCTRCDRYQLVTRRTRKTVESSDF